MRLSFSTTRHLMDMKKKKNNSFWEDENFIRDMLSADENTAGYWEQYLKEHPEKQEDFQQAREDFGKIKLNNYALPEETGKKLLNRVYASYAAQKKKRYRYTLYAALAAACIIGMLFILPHFHRPGSSVQPIATGGVPHLSPDSIHTRVTLITNAEEKIEIDEHAVIACDSNLYVQNRQGQKNYLPQTAGKTDGETVYHTLIVPPGKRSTLQLPDGSKVWVNAGTVLKFPSAFPSGKRLIQVQGEIYIEVTKDETKPFFVQTPQFTVNVLGTSFNVSAYSDEAEHSVVLVKGWVAVQTEKAEEFRLVPHQKLSLGAGTPQISPVDVYEYISWKDGILPFKGETVSEILKRLSRYYQVKIHCAPSVAARRCSGELILFDDIRQVLKTLSLLYNVSYRFESDTLIIE